MPLTEVPCGVALRFEQFCQGDLSVPDVAGIGGGHAIAIGMPASQRTAPRGRADGGTGVEAIKAEPGLAHCIKMRRLEIRVAVVSCVTPSLVIRHAKDDVRLLRASVLVFAASAGS